MQENECLQLKLQTIPHVLGTPACIRVPVLFGRIGMIPCCEVMGPKIKSWQNFRSMPSPVAMCDELQSVDSVSAHRDPGTETPPSLSNIKLYSVVFVPAKTHVLVSNR